MNIATMLAAKHRILVVALSLLGIGLVLLSTSKYGAGVSPDSVEYISAARNIVNGVGVISYDGAPLVLQPPLYPALLATADLIKIDPLTSAPVINALLFGLILYLAGLLFFKHLASSTLLLLGVTTILLARPMQSVAVMAWSDPLFILFVLIFLIHLEKFLVSKDTTSFVIFSLSAALACLTRYVGVTLILSGAVTLLILPRDDLKARLLSALRFVSVSALPLGIWLIRNYVVSGTLLGVRASSDYSILQNLARNFESTFNVWLAWYIPNRISEPRTVLSLIGVLAVFAIIGKLKLRTSFRRIGAIAIFVVIYASFLIFSTTTISIQTIDDRYLSPIYVPATLLLLLLIEKLFEPFRARFSRQVVNGLLVAAVVLWLVYYPFRNTVSDIGIRLRQGAGGYNSKIWRESALIQYLQHHPLETGQIVYSNAPDALYILANIPGQMSPAKTLYASNSRVTEITTPGFKDGNSYLVWVNQKSRSYLYTIGELQNLADMQQIIKVSDGAIYAVKRMP